MKPPRYIQELDEYFGGTELRSLRLDLSIRVQNILMVQEITTLQEMHDMSDLKWLRIPMLGSKSLKEIRGFLERNPPLSIGGVKMEVEQIAAKELVAGYNYLFVTKGGRPGVGKWVPYPAWFSTASVDWKPELKDIREIYRMRYV
jgi:hypothetical protein